MLEPIPPLSRSDTSAQMQRNKIVSAHTDMLNELGLTDYVQKTCASHPSYDYDEDQYILGQSGVNWLHYVLAPNKDNELSTWFLNNQNKDFAYECHKIFINMLNNIDAPTSHWLFKTPIHLLYFDTLLRHYPTAILIMTHRRLDEVLPSCAHLAIAYTDA
jgi:hypothetical protein